MNNTTNWLERNDINFKISVRFFLVILIFNLGYLYAYITYNLFQYLYFFGFTAIILFVTTTYIIYFYYKLKYKPNRYLIKVGDNSKLDLTDIEIINLINKKKLNYKELPIKRGFFRIDLKRYFLIHEKIEIGIQGMSSIIFIYIEPLITNNLKIISKWKKEIEDLIEKL